MRLQFEILFHSICDIQSTATPIISVTRLTYRVIVYSKTNLPSPRADLKEK